MKTLRRLMMLLLAIGVVGVVIAWTLPADVALRWLKPNLGPLQLSGVSGTVWQGRASAAAAFGMPLGALDWQVQKTPVLGGRVVSTLSLSGGAVTAAGDLTRDPDGSVLARSVQFAFPAELAAPALDIPALKLVGRIEGVLDEARLSAGWATGARGSAVWREAGVSGEAEARFGELRAEFASQPDGSITGTVKDDGSSNLAVDGQFVVHSGQFDASARLAARNGDVQVAEALRYIGEPQVDGTSLLKIHGQLFKLF